MAGELEAIRWLFVCRGVLVVTSTQQDGSLRTSSERSVSDFVRKMFEAIRLHGVIYQLKLSVPARWPGGWYGRRVLELGVLKVRPDQVIWF
jgi:hypothetical protein